MMIDDPFRIARRAGCIVQRQRIPFIRRQVVGEAGIPFLHQHRFIIRRPDARPFRFHGIDNIDQDRRSVLGQSQRLPHHAIQGTFRQHGLGFRVFQNEGNGRGIQPGIQRIQNRTNHRDRIMRLQQGWHIRA